MRSSTNLEDVIKAPLFYCQKVPQIKSLLRTQTSEELWKPVF